MLRLNIDEDSLRCERAWVTGRIWFSAEGVAFPSQDWTDDVLPVLGSMKTALSTIQDEEWADFYFFDGPYFVKLHQVGDGLVEVYCVCDRDEDDPVVDGPWTVEHAHLMGEYERAVAMLRPIPGAMEDPEVHRLIESLEA